MNERFHEVGTGNLRKCYGQGMVNDPNVPKTEIEKILYAVLVWLIKEYKSVKSTYLM